MASIYLLAFAIGIVAGLRTMTAPAVASWAAHLGLIDLHGTWLAFLAHPWAPWILSALAIGELIGDKLPWIPNRTVPGSFAARILSGALAGAAVGVRGDTWIGGAVAGAVGAIVGTLGGLSMRTRLAASFRADRPAALLEDGFALALAATVVLGLRV